MADKKDIYNPDKDYTFKAFDYKWGRISSWATDTVDIYRTWYLNRYGYKTPEGLKEFLADKKFILEAGCGQARDSKFFSELNSEATIVALDQSDHALEQARKNLESCANCEVMQGDLTNFTTPYTFDFISCDQVVHHTPNPAETLKHFCTHLKPGGVLNFSVCRKKNKYRDYVDDVLMDHATNKMTPEELWKFSEVVTELGKALYELGIDDVTFEDKKYPSFQRYVHDNVFRCWYSPDIDFQLSVSSNYDWFSNNPRFSAEEVEEMLAQLPEHTVLNYFEDDATISVSLVKK